ncbi:MAG: cytochrome C, partial [Planctomycetes bacterium]|nr:cytochrome C [Planctomycetota bacterium]
FPRLDLNLPKHRNVCLGVIIGAFVFALMTTLGSYRAYQFTESVQFCGLTCHSVMKPEHTAYINSPHARVTCTECHIGPGATWFARSKLSGTYQIYATLADKFERPIPTPLKNLRPAQETCEHCHWPQKFFGAVERVRTHFLSDEQNSPWTIRMLLKVGGGDPNHGPVGGIHWHMNVANRVEYIAQDDARQIIPWVRVTDRDGTATVYQSEGSKLTSEQIAKAPVRRMDCIDCHNRPTHIFRSPNESLDTALSVGRIDPTIPFIRKTAAAALVQPCATEAQGRDQIAEKLGVYYANYKDPAKIRAAIAEVQRIHRDNFFPEMKVNWRVYPDNIGHLNWPGCFRCHDGEHVSESGKKISAECNDCHTLIAQGRGASLDTVSAKGLEFQHPSDEIPPGAKCADCHTGGPQQ